MYLRSSHIVFLVPGPLRWWSSSAISCGTRLGLARSPKLSPVGRGMNWDGWPWRSALLCRFPCSWFFYSEFKGPVFLKIITMCRVFTGTLLWGNSGFFCKSNTVQEDYLQKLHFVSQMRHIWIICLRQAEGLNQAISSCRLSRTLGNSNHRL